MSCAQDIAKLTLDADKRTPSIRNLVGALDESAVVAELEDRYAIWVIPSVEEESDPEIAAALKRMEERERVERREQFREHLAELRDLWTKLSTAPAMTGFLTVRDKVSAHTEVRFVADKYQLVDIGTLGLKSGRSVPIGVLQAVAAQQEVKAIKEFRAAHPDSTLKEARDAYAELLPQVSRNDG